MFPAAPPPPPDGRYGQVSRDEYEERRAAALLREAEINACDCCDAQGYRPNGTLCPHTDKFDRAARRGMSLVRAALTKAKKNSVTSTLRARESAYRQRELVDRQRTDPTPPPCPQCGSIARCEHDNVEHPPEEHEV
jgi:hypothetical protein